MRESSTPRDHECPSCGTGQATDAVSESIRSALDASPVAAMDVLCTASDDRSLGPNPISRIARTADELWTAEVLHANDIAWRLFGATSAETLASHLQREMTRVEIQITLLACLRTGTLRHSFGVDLCTLSGSTIQVDLTANRVSGSDGLPARLVVYMEDRSPLEASLRNQEAYRSQLTQLVEQRNQELVLLRSLAGDRSRLIETLLRTRSPHVVSHMRRVAVLSDKICRRLGLSESERSDAVCAAALHDVGVLNVPYEILGRSGPISEEEFALVRQHPLYSRTILQAGGYPEPVLRIIAEHHERSDGSGYPRGLEGDDICVGARILAVADVVDAMTAQRPYRPPLGLESALAALSSESHRFDTRIVDACVAVLESEPVLEDDGTEFASLHMHALDTTSTRHRLTGLVS